jgi:hypothetical protein
MQAFVCLSGAWFSKDAATSALNTRALNGSNDFFSRFFASSTKNTAFYLKFLQNTEIPKLTKKSENNKAKLKIKEDF